MHVLELSIGYLKEKRFQTVSFSSGQAASLFLRIRTGGALPSLPTLLPQENCIDFLHLRPHSPLWKQPTCSPQSWVANVIFSPNFFLSSCEVNQQILMGEHPETVSPVARKAD
jgi:hypothetical protein